MVMKLGRNDLCPCQSGKKYKKCCNNTIEFVDVNLENELLAVQMDFVRWATRNYKSEIDQYMDSYYKKLDLYEEAEQTFNFFSYLWFFASVKQDDKLIWELYIETNPKSLANERVLNIIQAWIDVPPTVFIVKNWAPNQYVVVENIFTNEIQWVKSLQDHHSERESGIGLGVGTILPVEKGHAFFMTFFYVPEELETLEIATEQIKAVSERTTSCTDEFLSKSFMGVLEFIMLGTPLEEAIGRNLLDKESTDKAEENNHVDTEQSSAKQVLKEAELEVAVTKVEETSDVTNEQSIASQSSDKAELASSTTESKLVNEAKSDDNPLESEVLEAFIAYSRGCQKDDDFLNTGLDLWTTYCIKENPILRKPQVAAAALFYLVDSLGPEKGITQSQLAKDFFISAPSISSRYKVLQAALTDEIANLVNTEATPV